MADVIASIMARSSDQVLRRARQAAMAGAPNLSRWLETMQARPSVAKTRPSLG